MSKKKAIDYWYELGAYDLTVAESLLKSKHYLYAGFMCHQALEKILKAHFVKNVNKIPPYTHNLDKLIDSAGIRNLINENFENFIDKLSPLNIQARYPAYKEQIYKLISKKSAENILDKTKEIFQWLKRNLQ